MGKFLDGISAWLDNYKNRIYYSLIIVFFILAVVYAAKGYIHFQNLPPVYDGDDILNRLLTPFVLSTVRFAIVMVLGLFVSMMLFTAPLRRLKIMNVELEFPNVLREVSKRQEVHINQLHFVTSLKKNEEVFVNKIIDCEEIPFYEVVNDVMYEYESFFSKDLTKNISYEFIEYDNENINHFINEKHNRLIQILKNSEKDNDFIIRNSYFGQENVFLAKREEFGNNFVLLLTSNEHEFVDFDIEIINNIFEFSKGVCTIKALIPEV